MKPEYALKNLKKEWKELEDKVNSLGELNLSDAEMESIVTPVYIIAEVNLIAKYLGVKVGNKESKGYELLKDKKKER